MAAGLVGLALLVGVGVAAVALIGGAGLFASSGQAPTATSTPMPGPTTIAAASGGLEQAQLPPGVSKQRTNATRLLSAHLTQLRQTSLTVSVRQQVTTQLGNQSTTSTSRTTTRIADQQLVQRQTESLSSGQRTITHWATPHRHLVKRTLTRNDTTTTRHLVTQRPLTRTQALRLGQLQGIITGAHFRLTGSTVLNRTVVVRLHATTITDRQRLRHVLGYDVQDVRVINATALVTPIGVIRRLSVRATVISPGGQNATLQMQYRVTAINATTVTKPGWVATATQDATALNATRVDDGRLLDVTLVRGEALPAGSQLLVFANGSRFTATLPTTVEAGDTLYLAQANGTLQARVGARPTPASGTPFPPDQFQAVIIVTPRGVTAARATLPPS